MRTADELRSDLRLHGVPSGQACPEPAAGRGADPDLASAEIVRAWWRAREHARRGDPRSCPPRLLAAELHDRRRRDGTYVLALPILEEFGARIASSQHVLAFFDADGWMLSMTGSSRTAEWVAEIDFCPGTNWREELNADDRFGSAPAARSLIELPGPGTVSTLGTSWNCAAASILAPQSALAPPSADLLGMVAIAGPWTTETQTRLMARILAQTVEERLRSAGMVRDQVVEYVFRTASDEGDGMLAIGLDGRVLAANDAARRRLAFEGLEVPLAIRRAVVETLARTTSVAGSEPTVDCPGLPGHVELLASAVRYEKTAVGAIVRVLVARPARRRRAARSAPSSAPALARYGFRDVLGQSESICRVIALARMASRNELPVVLLGESGTGKELFAQAIHSESARGDGPFIAVNCGCIPAALLEAELFGYEAGTFTGARADGNSGKFEEASGGTLFLDEVSELTPQAQTALLRVLQEREVVRLGGSSPRPVDVRILAASNKSLSGEITGGRFRSDLYYRLNVLSIEVPPLRDRGPDLALLARAFLASAEGLVGRPGLAFSDDALRALAEYQWPGNVRELRNVVLRVAATAPAAIIEVMDLPEEVRQRAPCDPDPGPADSTVASSADPGREAVLHALDAASWNVARTARALGISRMTLYRWLRKYGIGRQG